MLLLSSSLVWALDVTEPPVISYEIGKYEVSICTEGEGEELLYIDIVDNPCIVARGKDGVANVASAMAQGE